MRGQNLLGVRFGRLVVLTQARQCLCQCDCGEQKLVPRGSLTAGKARSCGCLRREVAAARVTRHGQTGTPEWTAYMNAKNRCERVKDVRYADYGGRGIQMRFTCFEDFLTEIGPRPAGMSLDRIEANGHYEPGNIRWATDETQARNKRTSLFIEIDGVTRNLKEWCEIYNQPYKRVWGRISDGMPPKRALTKVFAPCT